MKSTPMTPMQLAAFERVCLEGLESAGRALMQLLGAPLALDAGGVREMHLEDLGSLIDTFGEDALVISLQLLGEAQGSMLLLFRREPAAELVDRLTEGAGGLGDDLGLSTLQELGNVLVCSFLNALGRSRRLTLLPSVPRQVEAEPRALTSAVRQHLGPVGDEVILLQIHFGFGSTRLDGAFLLIPERESLPRLCGWSDFDPRTP